MSRAPMSLHARARGGKAMLMVVVTMVYEM